MNENKTLGDYGDYDDANAFGLGADGRPVGWNPMWGSSIAVGAGTLASVITRQVSSQDKYAELIGFGVAAVPSLAMVFPKRTRAAGWAGLITSVLNNGVRFAEQMLSDKEKAKIEAAKLLAAAKEQVAQAQSQTAPPPGQQTTQGVNVQQIPAFAGPALGLVVPQAEPSLKGAGQQQPQLLGNGQPQLLGATSSAMSSHYGSTHFNKS